MLQSSCVVMLHLCRQGQVPEDLRPSQGQGDEVRPMSKSTLDTMKNYAQRAMALYGEVKGMDAAGILQHVAHENVNDTLWLHLVCELCWSPQPSDTPRQAYWLSGLTTTRPMLCSASQRRACSNLGCNLYANLNIFFTGLSE